MRGKLPRTQMKMKEIIKVYIIIIKSFKNIIFIKNIKNKDLNKLIIKILRYSPIKIKANLTPLYSVLNPETNSDSPSEKSKGVRLVSAKLVVNQIRNKGAHKKKIPPYLYIYIYIKFNAPKVIKHLSNVRDILTSYEIV